MSPLPAAACSTLASGRCGFPHQVPGRAPARSSHTVRAPPPAPPRFLPSRTRSQPLAPAACAGPRFAGSSASRPRWRRAARLRALSRSMSGSCRRSRAPTLPAWGPPSGKTLISPGLRLSPPAARQEPRKASAVSRARSGPTGGGLGGGQGAPERRAGIWAGPGRSRWQHLSARRASAAAR